jgi:hypothetical protein
MNIFTRRNALVGWIALRVARRKLRKRLGRGNSGRRGMLAGVGLAATGTAVALYARHGNGEAAESAR